jgi:hypothetical protein
MHFIEARPIGIIGRVLKPVGRGHTSSYVVSHPIVV